MDHNPNIEMEGEKQIVMLPFLAQGHFRPMLHLAILIHNHHPSAAITIATTQNNITKFSPLIPSSATPAIRFTPLPFDLSKHGLPPNGDNTDSLPNHLKPKLFEAIPSLQAPFENLLSDMIIGTPSHRPPIAVIADMAMSWGVEAAKKLNIFSTTFNPACAYGSAAFMSIWLHLPHLKTDNDDIELPGFPKGTVFKREQVCMTCNNSDGKDPLALVIRPSISASFKASAILVNTAKCIEKNGIEILKSVSGDEKLPVWDIGPLLPSSFFTSSSETAVITESDPCLQWLHLHPPRSVLYIAFGSENTISPSQMMNLALGLEESGTKFLWAIRPPLGCQPKEPFRSEWLPPNFEQRMREKKQGLVMTGWAPQLSILSHASTGGFLSHCGWSSTLEGLSTGVPIIGWPLFGEQYYNSKMLVENGVGVELAAGNRGEIAIGDVAQVLRLVMGESEKREEMLRKCGLMKEEIRSAVVEEGVGSAAYNLNEFMKTAFPEKRTHMYGKLVES